MDAQASAGYPKVSVGGIPLTRVDPAEAVELVCVAARDPSHGPIDVHLVNAYTIALAGADDDYRRILLSSSLNLTDGKPVTWASRVLYRRSLKQVRGPSLMRTICTHANSEPPLRHYFLGSTEATVRALITNLRAVNPDICVAGWDCPPFRSLDEAERRAQDEAIKTSGANLLWVGLGTPGQDYETARLAETTGVTAVAVGAAFDFLAGTKKEAPAILTRVGLEWLFRFLTEPRRLWRRYLVGNAQFVYRCLRPPTRPMDQRT